MTYRRPGGRVLLASTSSAVRRQERRFHYGQPERRAQGQKARGRPERLELESVQIPRHRRTSQEHGRLQRATSAEDHGSKSEARPKAVNSMRASPAGPVIIAMTYAYWGGA